jgi:Flp pilus assembly secretin CpaC
VVEQRLDQLPVTIDVIEQDTSSVLASVARRLGVEVTRQGQLYYMGTLRREDRGLLVRRVRRLKSDEITNAVKVLQSDQGATVAFSDGLLVVGDRVDVLRRITQLLDDVEATDNATWVVQLYLVSFEEARLADFGFDVSPAIDVAVSFASGSTALQSAATAANLHAGIGAVLRAAASHEGVEVVAQPLFVLGDGETAAFSRGEKIPIPRRSVSDQGTVTTTGFETVQTGLQVSATVRELRESATRLSVDVSMSDVARTVEADGVSAPVIKADTYKTQSEVISGGVYLLGSVERAGVTRSAAWPLRLGQKHQASNQVLQIWARAYRIAGPAQIGAAAVIESNGSESGHFQASGG